METLVETLMDFWWIFEKGIVQTLVETLVEILVDFWWIFEKGIVDF